MTRLAWLVVIATLPACAQLLGVDDLVEPCPLTPTLDNPFAAATDFVLHTPGDDERLKVTSAQPVDGSLALGVELTADKNGVFPSGDIDLSLMSPNAEVEIFDETLAAQFIATSGTLHIKSTTHDYTGSLTDVLFVGFDQSITGDDGNNGTTTATLTAKCAGFQTTVASASWDDPIMGE